jgi:hypothetical protein
MSAGTPTVLAYFHEQGAKGGGIGGRRVVTMTREQRVARVFEGECSCRRGAEAEGKKDEGEVSGGKPPWTAADGPGGIPMAD